ncbi:MAG TPA: DUF4412 domain-containing protein [Candidatus Binatia bacterium]|nr:DUF4412 domain-containing protein [Candidatus Binatia bacterium]
MRTLTWFVGLLTVAVTASAKDLTIHQRTSIGVHGGTAQDVMEYWSGSKMVSDDSQMRSIVDLDARTFTMLDKAKKTYFTETFDEMRSQVERAHQAMQKQLESLPPQAREMMGNFNPDTPITVKATGKTEKIAGYDAKEYALEGGATSGSVWASDALLPPVAPEKVEALRKAMNGMPGPGGKLAGAMVQIKGLPLRTTMMTTMGPQKVASSTEVIEVSEKVPPADVMTIPDGFTKTAPPSFEMPGHGGSPHP